VDPSLQIDNRIQSSSQAVPVSKHNKSRTGNARDERFRSDLHTEAVQAALAKYKERKMPMPSKRRSVLVQSSVEACTPPDTSSASEDEGSLRRQGRLATSTPYQGHSHPAVEHWFNRVIQGSSTSSSASSTSSHPGGRSITNNTAHAALNANAAATALADLMAHTRLGQSHMASHMLCYSFLPMQ
ncbi:Disco-interacting protein 2 A, partial [Xenotaenia resolanae]